jgi:kynurenine formamidase
MPGYPGTPGPEITAESSVEQDGFMETRLNMFSHTGTHIDAPSHMIHGGLTLDRLPVSRFSGMARKVDLTRCSRNIQSKDIESLLHDSKPFDILLLHTGWDRYWGHPLYYSDFPVLDEGAINLILSLNIKILGMDMPSCDPVETPHFTNHHKLLGNNIMLIENLTKLNLLPHAKSFGFAAFPLFYEHADGSPVRAMAWL